MKYTWSHREELFGDHISAAYFFNARGNDSLEKTIAGMLRSLSFQLLDRDPLLYERFLPRFRDKMKKQKVLEWRDAELKDFLLSEAKTPQSKPLLFLIDALDECSEFDVREAVRFLEELSTAAVDANVTLNICLSSRHYPTISMRRRLELVVEDKEEHDEDIAIYVRDKLTKRDETIEKGIFEKASGVFMWVILVVAMLNQAYDEGRVEAMQRKLNELPSDLEKVFETFLGNKSSKDRDETIFMLQCVLFTRRGLKPEELYFAMVAGINAQDLGAWDRSEITGEIIQRRITTSSKGLIEIRKGEDKTVQFIHESVNDFLLRNRRLQTLAPALELNAIGTSHECLRACCMSYILRSRPASVKKGSKGDELLSDYPFLQYASTHVLDHAEAAQANGIMQKSFVHYLQQQREDFERLRRFHNTFESIPYLGCNEGITPLYMLSFHGYHELVKTILFEVQMDVNTKGGAYGNALQAASSQGEEKIGEMLLENGADSNAQGGLYGSALQAAVVKGEKEIVQILVEKGADVNAQWGSFGNALQAASYQGEKEIVTMLLKKGANVNVWCGPYGSALQAASDRGGEEIVAMLLEKGAEVNALGRLHLNALQLAIIGGNESVVAKLLDKGADVNAPGGHYVNALQAAAFPGGVDGNAQIVEMLLERGADITTHGGIFGNALQAALISGISNSRVFRVLELLLEKAAGVNAQDGPFSNTLQAAIYKQEEGTVAILLEKGTDVNAQGGPLGTALQVALYRGDKKIVEMLLEKGANVNVQGGLLGHTLQVASFLGHTEIVEVLLEKGADINAQGGLYGHALQAAVIGKEYIIVQMLLERGANINAQGGPLGSALQAAIFSGDKGITAMLLEKGADINARDGICGSSLQAAALSGKVGMEAIILEMIEKEADINAPGGMYGSSLQAASFMGEQTLVEMLLEKGADVNAQGGRYGNALRAASIRGHEKVVAMLLENGADIDAQDKYRSVEEVATGASNYGENVSRGINALARLPRTPQDLSKFFLIASTFFAVFFMFRFPVRRWLKFWP